MYVFEIEIYFYAVTRHKKILLNQALLYHVILCCIFISCVFLDFSSYLFDEIEPQRAPRNKSFHCNWHKRIVSEQFQRLHRKSLKQYFGMKMQNFVEIKFLILMQTTSDTLDTYTGFSLLQSYFYLKIKMFIYQINEAFVMTVTFSRDTFLLQFQRLYIQEKFEQYFGMKMQNFVEIKFLILCKQLLILTWVFHSFRITPV